MGEKFLLTNYISECWGKVTYYMFKEKYKVVTIN